MESDWATDPGVIQAIDDALMALKPHVDDVLNRLLIHTSLPAQEADLLLFGVLGNFCAGYHQARLEHEPPSDAWHRGLAAVLGNESVGRMLRSLTERGVSIMIGEK